MRKLKEFKINGYSEPFFNYDLFLFTIEEDQYDVCFHVVVTESFIERYIYKDNYSLRLTFDDNSSLTIDDAAWEYNTEVGNADIPIVEFVAVKKAIEDFPNINVIIKNIPLSNKLTEGINISDIRKIEMPIHKVEIKAELDLPIDIEEWIYSLEGTNNEWLKEAIADYWEKKKVSN